MHANDDNPPSRLAIVDDDPAEGDEVCIAINPGHVYLTDWDEAFNIGLDLLHRALLPKRPSLSLRILEGEFPEVTERPATA
jgi:hypothetical protein